MRGRMGFLRPQNGGPIPGYDYLDLKALRFVLEFCNIISRFMAVFVDNVAYSLTFK